MSEGIQEPAGGVSRMVPAPGGRLHVTEYPGAAPPLVLMHGFPDDSRIYDRLVLLLAPRRVVAVDWLGYGRSDRADPGSPDGVNHQRELRAVLDSFGLGRVTLVGHDASARTPLTSPRASPAGSGS
jgi:haloalkane dehalogenase